MKMLGMSVGVSFGGIQLTGDATSSLVSIGMRLLSLYLVFGRQSLWDQTKRCQGAPYTHARGDFSSDAPLHRF